MFHVRALWALAAATLVFAATADAQAGRSVVVSTARDAGSGSFRAAIAEANADSTVAHVVLPAGIKVVPLTETVHYTGAQALSIEASGAILDGSRIAAGPVFHATGGGSLAIQGLTVRRGPAEGVTLEVPPDASGTVRLWLSNVDVLDNLGHGVLVNDQLDSSTTDGVPPNPGGSAASVDVTVLASRFLRNGYSVSDRDGLRVNEGGPGDLSLTVRLLHADHNAADGVEIDERGSGDVRVDVLAARLTWNGVFDPADLDDGFDIDEYGEGSILGIVAESVANDNYEEGLDFNENDAGDLRVDLIHVEAQRNGEEGIDLEEDDDFAGGGDLAGLMVDIRVNGNGRDGGDAGLKIREKGTGNLGVELYAITATANRIAGVSVREDAIGHLTATVTKARLLDNAGHGIDFDENRATTGDAGKLTATVSDSTASGNTGAGVRADQQTPGTGSLTLAHVTTTGNAGGATTGGGVAVTVTP